MNKREFHLSVEHFLSLKNVQKMLTKNTLTDKQIDRLKKVLSYYNYYQIVDCEKYITICHMINNDLTNYIGRCIRLGEHKRSTDLLSHILRYGKKSGLKIWEELRETKRNELPNNINHWLKNGCTLDEAQQKVKEHQKKASEISAKKLTGSSEYSCRSIKYWLKNGCTLDEAQQKVKKIQSTFTLEKCIEKYGEDEGKRIFLDRQERWQKTLNNKSIKEKENINLKKGHSIESYIANGYSTEEASKLSYAYYKKRKNYSNISQVCFDMLSEKTNYTIYYKLKNYEKQISGKNVDCYIKDKKLVIEFFGDYWHCRKTFYDDEYIRYGQRAKDVRKNDEIRLKKILTSNEVNGIIIIWESDFRKNPELMINKIMESINESNKECNYKRIKEII